MTPPERTHAKESHSPGKPGHDLPSAGKVFDLREGVSRLGFTGQTWKAHPAGGIDFDLYVAADAPMRAHIGNWAHLWHPGTEEGEFRAANQCPRFEERQHILRIRGKGAFTTLILPWRKGQRPEGLAVSREGDVMVVKSSRGVVRIGKDSWESVAAP